MSRDVSAADEELMDTDPAIVPVIAEPGPTQLIEGLDLFEDD